MSKSFSIPGTPRHSAGFTLLEAVMVIVITGILAGIVAVFITKPVQGYVDSVRRAELTDAADVVVRRMAREVHLAVPNSLRVGDSSGNSGSCDSQPGVTCYIEFILTSGGGRYRDATTDGSSAGGNSLSFTSTSIKTFDVLGMMPSNPAIAAGDYIVIYNLGPGNAPADAYVNADPCVNCNRAKVSTVDSANQVVTLVSNPFGAWMAGMHPPYNSFQVVPGGVKAVTYACPTVSSGDLTRYWNYGFNASLATVPSGTSALLATHVTCTGVSFFAGLLSITITLTDPNSNESVTLFREIHVDNTP
ncbi:MAG: prepilin-type N-terminal cleavage/methylation domain-containing protein [Sterolibacterium sp.]